MIIQHHYLKIQTKYYQLMESGKKTFEVRRNDRDYKVGDMVYLGEWVNGEYTGRTLPQKEITYIFYGGITNIGVEEGFCVMGLK